MNRIILPCIALLVFSIAVADSAIQTDWFGGSGTWGPVNYWNDEFYSDSGINYYYTPNSLLLGRVAFTNPIEQNITRTFSGDYFVSSADIDDDSDMDILLAAFHQARISWWENIDGSGTSWTEHIFAWDFNGAKSIPVDMDDDGDMDVLGAAMFNNEISWWENIDGSGTDWTKHIVDGDFNGAMSVYSEDIDGDGDLDILGAAFSDDDISWWENIDGSGTDWTKHIVDGDFNGAMSVYSKDIDSDGDMDILGSSLYTNMAWWENIDGSGLYWYENPIVAEPYTSFAEDIDDDGDMDILDNERQSSEIKWLENADGSGTSWINHTIADSNGPWAAYSVDLDSDGNMGLLGASRNNNVIVWWENIEGSGVDWLEHIVHENDFHALSMCADDINGDGYMDLVASAPGTISWWDCTEYSTCGELISSTLYLGNDPGWGSIDWTCQKPAGTAVSFQVRSCDSPDSTEMGAWSDTLFTPCNLFGILDENDSYFQYKAILQTSDPSVTPILEDLTITWDPLGIEGGEPFSFQLLPLAPNPVSDSPVIRFSIPEAGTVALSVFDISGRLVSEILSDKYSEGYHDVQMEEFSPGVYFCRMTAGDFTATQRFVVIQ